MPVLEALPRLHLVTPDRADADVLDRTVAALTAGAPLVQVRRKAGTDRERLAWTEQVVTQCRALGAACLVDDRVDLARAVWADGVHVGDDDVPVAVARRLLGPHAVVGATVRDPESAVAARSAGATYLGVGPVYGTTTKDGLPDPIGVDGLAAVCEAVGDLPVIAIAGVTAERVPEVVAAGAHGVAVVGAVYDSPDPAGATRALLDALAD